MEATARAYPGKTARAGGLWGQEGVCREELEEAPGSRQPRCARRCPFILHAGEMMEKVEIQNLARPRVRYGHVTDTQEAKTSCCSLPRAEHWKMGQKKKKKEESRKFCGMASATRTLHKSPQPAALQLPREKVPTHRNNERFAA